MEIDDKIYLELCRLGIISNSTRQERIRQLQYEPLCRKG